MGGMEWWEREDYVVTPEDLPVLDELLRGFPPHRPCCSSRGGGDSIWDALRWSASETAAGEGGRSSARKLGLA
jgi:hypothetical protein